MAVYNFNDFVDAIVGDDKPTIAEIASKYPLAFAAIAKACAQAPEAMREVGMLVGDATTGIKLNSRAKALFDNDGMKAVEEAPAAEEAVEEAPKRRRGRPRKNPVADEPAPEAEKKRGRGRPRKNPVPAPEPVEDTEEAEEASNPYEGKKAMELYKLCKERGIEVAPRQKAAVYAELLVKDDESVDDTEDDFDEDDWDI